MNLSVKVFYVGYFVILIVTDYDVDWSDDSCMTSQREFGSGHVLLVIFLALTWSG